ncbi:hypothetical protein HYX16_01850 [Candidatus Woesearchaeota archaeon]|nr:hypothetical protein [Candidatus Woesearchaeota archaeon]
MESYGFVGNDGASLIGKIRREEDIYQKNELGKKDIPEYQNYRCNIAGLLYEDEEKEGIFEANDYQMGNHIPGGFLFGFTDLYSKRIVLSDRLNGEDRKKVLEHEKHHRNNTDSEEMTREKTSTSYFSPNPVVSPVRLCYN